MSSNNPRFDPLQPQAAPDARQGQPPLHPPATTIEDLLTFKLLRLVAVNEKAGSRWSQTLFDLSLNEWRLFGVVFAHQPVRAGDAARLLVMDKSQLSRVIKALVGRKLMLSRADPQDARAVELSLTPKGVALHEKVLAEALGRNEGVLAPLSRDEVAVLRDLLDRLIGHNVALLDAAGER